MALTPPGNDHGSSRSQRSFACALILAEWVKGEKSGSPTGVAAAVEIKHSANDGLPGRNKSLT